MADLDGSLYSLEPTFSGRFDRNIPGVYYGLTSESGTTFHYKMRAQDSGVPLPGFITWVSVGSPDLTGSGYLGGSPVPVGPFIVGSIATVDKWAVT